MENKIKDFEERITALERQVMELNKCKAERLRCNPFVDTLIHGIELLGIPQELLFGTSQKRGRLFFARCVFASNLRKYGYSFGEIGRMMNRSHCTVIHYVRSYKTVKEEPRFDKAFADFINEFHSLLNE